MASIRPNFAQQVGARQAVGGNAEMHHAAGQRAGLVDFHAMAQTRRGDRRPTSRSAGAHHQHAFAGRRGSDTERPAVLGGQVTEKTFHGVNADRGIERPRGCSAVSHGW